MTVRESEEGKLSWIDVKLADELNVTATTKCIFKHFSENKKSSEIYVGTMKAVGSEPKITWALLEDWEKNKVSHQANGQDS
ncbi:hypothetical protein ACPV3A_18855 [Paenibacillus sp. Dod16]|uniref:hypothetical protein n=1 Tax=Paenibacillus sp. Dod16 TaxID=3416392 RepID=UPI003CE7721B